jgi:hypothetical protein
MRDLSRAEALGRREPIRAALARRATLALALCVSLTAVCLHAPVANAGEYHVYACRTPAGIAAPTSGWGGSINGSWMSDTDSCASGGSLTAALDGGVEQPANASAATWTFSAPAGTQIAAARLWWAGEALTSRPYGTTVFSLMAPEDIYSPADVFDKCENAEEGCTVKGNPNAPMAPENLVTVPSGNLSGATHIYMTASCGGGTGTNCPANGSAYSVWVSLYGADITLEQDSQPSPSNVGGELASAATVSGTSDLTFSATDSPSGVYEAIVEVDGHVVESPILNENSGHCRNVGQSTGGLPAFLYTQPCLQSLSADVSLNTKSLSNGQHHLLVSVTDAAGNSAVVLDRQITVANGASSSVVTHTGAIGPGSPAASRGALNGTNASDQAKLTARWTGTSKALRISRYGSVDRATGRLTTASGQPISGAVLDVYETPAAHGAVASRLGGVSTGPAGQWTVTLPKGISSSTVSFDYRSHLDDTVAAATATLTLRVHAGIALRIEPRHTSVGGTIFFSGTLHGTPIPEGGKQLVLEASAGREWVEFRTIATNAKGHYRASYRFKFAGPIRYQFRVLSRYEADFPFLSGASNVVDVYER